MRRPGKLEPRTATYKKRLEVMETLSSHGIPVQVLVAPVIPGLNDHELPEVIRRAAKHGASDAGYIVLRLNGAVSVIFEDWIRKTFPGMADKVLSQVCDLHGGKLNDSRFGTRMKGEGQWAETIRRMYTITRENISAIGRRSRLTCLLSDGPVNYSCLSDPPASYRMPSQLRSDAAGICFLFPRSSSWSSPILPVVKYLLSGCEKYQPHTLAAGCMARVSVRRMEVCSVAFSQSSKVRFSVWSGQAG